MNIDFFDGPVNLRERITMRVPIPLSFAPLRTASDGMDLRRPPFRHGVTYWLKPIEWHHSLTGTWAVCECGCLTRFPDDGPIRVYACKGHSS